MRELVKAGHSVAVFHRGQTEAELPSEVRHIKGDRRLWTRGYVENVAAAIALAVVDERAKNRIYNVGEAVARSEAEWLRAIGRAANWHGHIRPVPSEQLPPEMRNDNVALQYRLVIDTTRLREELGYTEHITPEEPLQRTVAWQREHPPQTANENPFDYEAEDAVLKQLKEAG